MTRAAALAWLALGAAAFADPPPAPAPAAEARPRELRIEPTEIVGSPSSPALGEPLERIPENVQQVGGGDVSRRGVLDTTELLGRRAAGVHLTETDANPFQPDLTYRGFVASPVLGNTQGLSVFVDGVRVNEMIGDAVNWDLVPQASVASLEVVPGAEPRYGRNTLGGAVAVQTKRGTTSPGSAAEAYAGSFGRRQGTLETGGVRGDFDYYALGNVFHEDGFRDFSPSDVRQFFGSLGWRPGDADVRLTYTLARNELTGNSFTPESFLARDRSAVYTQPDLFKPDLDFVHVAAARSFGGWRLAADLEYRDLGIRQSSADAAPRAEDTPPGEPLAGVLRIVRSNQRSGGGTFEASHASRPFGGENDLSLGFQGDRGGGDLRLFQETGAIDRNRGVAVSGPRTPQTSVAVATGDVAAFFRDTWTPDPRASLTVSARWDREHERLDDRLFGRASGNHRFDGVSPSVGLTVHPAAAADVFARYGRSFRAPTVVELGCASEADPCPLPIALADDPALKKVRADTFEGGLRVRGPSSLRFTVALFRTDLHDDILFVTRTQSLGFFRNVGDTRRQGLESLLSGRVGSVEWFANYSWTRASFETTETLPSAAGDDTVRPGDVVPGVPDHLLKAGLDAPLFAGLSLGLDLQFTGRQFLRGDEANRRGALSPYVVVNGALHWTYGRLTLFARAQNLFDARYENFGSFGANVFAGGRVERFLSPGAPLGAWAGARLDL